jgi:glutamate formiminotransferase/glutamate formiminotransferase/formiminotetrahydrofolate cyclodeaminase
MLLAVPNVSEGRDVAVIDELSEAFGTGVELLDAHSDPDHNRSVFTLAGDADALTDALVHGAEAAATGIDMDSHVGVHPCIGALDVCPVVWVSEAEREAARAAAHVVGERLASSPGVPVFFYGELAATPERRERAFFRRGGLGVLTDRMQSGELRPDVGPVRPHPTAGATLVTARPPLVAFNLELDSPDSRIAQEIASKLREAGGGPPGVRAVGLPLSGDRSQVSVNIGDPVAAPLATVVKRVQALAAPHGATVVEAELVGLAPRVALEGYPAQPRIRGFDPARHLIESRIE